jgi:acylphosphatase
MREKLLYKITIKGRVQGVGFRWSAAGEARKRDITGFAENRRDGSVYIEAEGSPDMVRDYLEWCRTGPAHALVESVDMESSPPVNHTDFRIKH